MTKELIEQEKKPQISIIKNGYGRGLNPTTIDETWRVAEGLCKANLTPDCYRNKPSEAFFAINLGLEIGLSPVVSLSKIAVVRGKATIESDMQLALVRSSGKLKYFKEYFEGEEGSDDFTAICELQRDGDEERTTESFSIKDAKKAGLLQKPGTWQTHTKRMLRYKARSFALRDKFADILMGLSHSQEEMQGEEIIVDHQPVSKTANLDIDSMIELSDTKES